MHGTVHLASLTQVKAYPGMHVPQTDYFSVPVQYVCWAELLYIQLLTPKASFLGHLGGILAGLLHVNVLEHLALPSGGLSFRWAQRGLCQFPCLYRNKAICCHGGTLRMHWLA